MATLSLIVAAADNNVIGKDNKMPWHIPEDFKHFKDLTLGKPCIMGRKTFESIFNQLGKALPNRTSIVVTQSGFMHAQAISVPSLDAAIAQAKIEKIDEIMIIGGAQIYALALERNLVNKIYLTRVHQSPQGDAFFPVLDSSWKERSKENFNGYSFITYEKT